jgi:hypothetical protein
MSISQSHNNSWKQGTCTWGSISKRGLAQEIFKYNIQGDPKYLILFWLSIILLIIILCISSIYHCKLLYLPFSEISKYGKIWTLSWRYDVINLLLFIQHEYGRFESCRCYPIIFWDTFARNSGPYHNKKDIHWTTSYKIAGVPVGEEISTLHDGRVTVWAAATACYFSLSHWAIHFQSGVRWKLLTSTVTNILCRMN